MKLLIHNSNDIYFIHSNIFVLCLFVCCCFSPDDWWVYSFNTRNPKSLFSFICCCCWLLFLKKTRPRKYYNFFVRFSFCFFTVRYIFCDDRNNLDMWTLWEDEEDSNTHSIWKKVWARVSKNIHTSRTIKKPVWTSLNSPQILRTIAWMFVVFLIF